MIVLCVHRGFLESTVRVYFRKKWKPANVRVILEKMDALLLSLGSDF